MRSDVQEGARFPDYQLPDHDGIERRLSELQGANPMLVHLARGGFDPKEHRFLRHLADTYPDFRAAYTRVVVISTDGQLEINEFRDSVGAEFPFLAVRTVRSETISTSSSTRIRSTTRWSRIHSSSARALRSSGSTTATGSGVGRPSRSFIATSARCCAQPVPTSTSPYRDCARPGTAAKRRDSWLHQSRGPRSATPRAPKPGLSADGARPRSRMARSRTAARRVFRLQTGSVIHSTATPESLMGP
jgi:AhpC/TSA family